MTSIGWCAAPDIPPPPRPTHQHTWALRSYGWNTMSCQILTSGIAHWFTPDGDAVVGYVPVGGTWVAAGAPVCSPERLAETVAAFATAAAQQRRRVCYFGAQERLVAVGAAHGLTARLRLGAQPVWDPHGWPAILAHKASLRAAMRALAAGGATYVTLGLAPLAEHASADSPAPPLPTQVLLALARAHGRRFYNFAGLESDVLLVAGKARHEQHISIPKHA